MEKPDTPVDPLPTPIQQWLEKEVVPLAGEVMAGKRRRFSGEELHAVFLEEFKKAKGEGSST